MSAAAERLRALGFYNPYTIAEAARGAGLPDVYVAYRPTQPGRGYVPAAWQVIRPGFHTDPDGHWMDRGHKSFMPGSPRLPANVTAERAALDWAAEKYGIEEWMKIPGAPRTWFPKPVAEMIKRLLREAKVNA